MICVEKQIYQIKLRECLDLFTLIENYLKLKSNQNIIQLQQIIVELESQLVNAREFYNEAVKMLNTKIEQILYNIVANIDSIKPMSLYRAPEKEKQELSTRLQF
jgi:LemA protein